jgi:beta-N-acetylhexosaminidase
MTAHIRVPALTGELPATFSPEALLGLLRKELGFGGTIVSDGLEMRGASGVIGVPEAAVRALAAGNDLLCIGGEFAKPGAVGAQEIVEATLAAIVEAVRIGRLTPERLAEAAARNALLGIPRPWPPRCPHRSSG